MKVFESPLRDALRLIIWYPFRWLVLLLPVRAAFGLFGLMGRVHCALAPGRSRRLLGTFKAAGCASEGRLACKSFENHYIDRMHIFLYPRLRRPEQLAPFVRMEGLEHLDAARREGRGALIVQPHFGPVQITLLALALHGYDPIQIGYPTDRGLSWIGRHVAFSLRMRYEGMLAAPIISAESHLGRVYKHLKRGGVVLTTGDMAGGGAYLGRQHEVDFLGARVRFPLGPADLALRTGALYVPTFIIVERPDSYRIVFGHPIEPTTGEAEQDMLAMSREFASVSEGYVRNHPYLWHHWEELCSPSQRRARS